VGDIQRRDPLGRHDSGGSGTQVAMQGKRLTIPETFPSTVKGPAVPGDLAGKDLTLHHPESAVTSGSVRRCPNTDSASTIGLRDDSSPLPQTSHAADIQLRELKIRPMPNAPVAVSPAQCTNESQIGKERT
jgi:hypothetical protein